MRKLKSQDFEASSFHSKCLENNSYRLNCYGCLMLLGQSNECYMSDLLSQDQQKKRPEKHSIMIRAVEVLVRLLSGSWTQSPFLKVHFKWHSSQS